MTLGQQIEALFIGSGLERVKILRDAPERNQATVRGVINKDFQITYSTYSSSGTASCCLYESGESVLLKPGIKLEDIPKFIKTSKYFASLH